MKSQFPSQTGAPWMKTSVIEHSDASTPTTESIVFLHSISSMPVYASKSVEELRLEHYQKNDTRDALVMQSYSCLERPTPFLMAVLQGRLALCKALSRSQWLWKHPSPMFCTDVHVGFQIMMGVFVACIQGKVEMVECLLKELSEGGVVSADTAVALSKLTKTRDEHGRTLCIIASMHGHYDVLQSIITLLKTPLAGSLAPWIAHADAQDTCGKSALIYACESGNRRIVEILLKAHVNFNIQDTRGKSALAYAVGEKNHRDIILALLDAGADCSIIGNHIMVSASEHGHVEMLNAVIKLADVNEEYIAGRTPLMFAIQAGQDEAVRSLLNAGADATVRDDNDDTILTLAAEHGSIGMVYMCLEHMPADMIDCCTMNERWTALMLASKRGDTDIVKAILLAGASVLHKRDIQMMTVIDLVCDRNHENKNAILELLREREAEERLAEEMSRQQIDETDQDDTIEYSDLSIDADRVIGSGSFSVVRRGTWRGMEVAIKQLTSNLSLDTQDILRAEVQVLSSLRHPSIVAYYGYCENPPCIVLELCSESLSNLLEKCALGGDSNVDISHTMTWRCRLQIAADTAEGMKYLHQVKRYYHRDLRTANILITDRYQAKIADMGMTRKTLGVSRNSAGTIAASTPRWLAPEMLRNNPFTAKSDIYSFGTVLYELATWSMPWADIADYAIPHAILVNQQRLTIPDLENLPGPQPTHTETFIKFTKLAEKCLAFDPSEIPEFGEIVSELKEMLRHEHMPADQQLPSCIVCFSNVSECAYINCGHCCVCGDCAQISPCTSQCPVCRAGGHPTKIYFS